MEIISIRDIDMSSLDLCNIQGTKSTVYTDGYKCYKLLNGLYKHEKKELLKKFKDMSEIAIDDIIFPEKLVLKRGNLVGYIMEYFCNSINLYDCFCRDRYIDVNDILLATKKASLIVRKAHENGIILQDISFDNILIDNYSNIKICDIDGCQYKNYKSPFIPQIMDNYYRFILKKQYIINKNFDNQALLLSMIITIYHQMIINMKDYDTLSDKIETLKNLRSIVESFLKYPETEIPYLDEIIDENDHYIIDRNKQVSVEKALANDYRLK